MTDFDFRPLFTAIQQAVSVHGRAPIANVIQAAHMGRYDRAAHYFNGSELAVLRQYRNAVSPDPERLLEDARQAA